MQKNDLIRVNGNIFWNREAQSLHVDDESVKLSVSQKRVLRLLIENINKPIQNSDIFYEVHDSLDKEFNEKSVRNLMSGLRKTVPDLNIENIYGGYYMLKNENITKDIKFKEQLFEIVEQSKNPIVITDPNEQDNPIIYVNSSFCELFGYEYEEVLGKNCRFLHSNDKEQKVLKSIKEAITSQKPVEVNIRDYTKDGDMVYEDITISPVFDKQKDKLIYFLGIYKNLTSMQQFLDKAKDVL